MKVVLELQDQPSNIKKVTVRHDIVIGRGAECNLRLSAPQVSRRHCFLRVSSDGASLTDLDSSNGTWMNGKKLSSGKRYNISDGAVLAVGPVQFIARVRSEVAVGEQLQVHLQDDRIEAELTSPADDPAADSNVDATISDLMPDDDSSNMNFAIEQAGASAAEDEPTADFVPSDSADRSLYVDVEVLDASDAGGHEILNAVPVDEETVAYVDDIIGAEAGADAGIVDEVDLDPDADVVEVIDEEIELIDEDELLVVDDDQVVLTTEDEEILEPDDEITEVVDESADSGELTMPDDEGDELKDFLKGLN